MTTVVRRSAVGDSPPLPNIMMLSNARGWVSTSPSHGHNSAPVSQREVTFFRGKYLGAESSVVSSLSQTLVDPPPLFSFFFGLFCGNPRVGECSDLM